MTESATPVVTAADPNVALVALSAGDMPATQAALIAWCDQKHQALEQELEDLQDHLRIAISNGWKLRCLQASIGRTEKRLTYYANIKIAVEHGYLIVPNFPVTVLAVRVRSRRQRRIKASYEAAAAFEAKPELLPAGEGRYVDDWLFTHDVSHEEPDAKGGTKLVRQFVSGDYDAPDFPFQAIKPAVLAATERAMVLRVFDAIGMVESSGRDPIMVGQLIDPRGHDRRVTFFIAWWLNTTDL